MQPDFQSTRGSRKEYCKSVLNPKRAKPHGVRVRNLIVVRRDHRVPEIGRGTGLFPGYLTARGGDELFGIDNLGASPTPYGFHSVSGRSQAINEGSFPSQTERTFGRVATSDVPEHFTPQEGVRLLTAIRARPTPGGRVVVRVPNAGSPRGGQYQHGDLTHRTAFVSIGLRHIVVAAGYRRAVVFPAIEGGSFHRAVDKVLQAILNRCLMTPPEIWTANMLAVFVPRRD